MLAAASSLNRQVAAPRESASKPSAPGRRRDRARTARAADRAGRTAPRARARPSAARACRAASPGAAHPARRRRSSRPPDPLDELAEALARRRARARDRRPPAREQRRASARERATGAGGGRGSRAEGRSRPTGEDGELALAAQPQVDLGQVEAARMLAQRLEAPLPESPARATRTGSSTTAHCCARRGRATDAAATGRSGRRPRSPWRSRWGRRCRPRSRWSRPARDLGRGEARIGAARPRPSGGRHEADAERLSCLASRRAQLLGGTRLHRRRALDERADDIGLPALLLLTGGISHLWQSARFFSGVAPAVMYRLPAGAGAVAAP